MNKPLVSVLIPTRDRPDMLHKALNSVLNQDYKNLQIILHDNSTNIDSKSHIIDLLEDDRVQYIKTKDDLSMTENWNTGYSHCNGEFFVRLDDDNIYTPDFISSSINDIVSNNLSLMISSALYVDLYKEEYYLIKPEKKLHLLNLKLFLYLEYNALTDSYYVIYSKKLLDSILGDGFDLYETNLPDRFLHYRIINYFENIRDFNIGFTTEPRGITRFDYRPRNRKDFTLKYIDYSSHVNSQDIIKSKDCSENFALHRLLTIKFFFENFNSKYEQFFYDNIQSKKNFLSFAICGHVSQKKSEYLFKEIVVFNRMFLTVIMHLIMNPIAVHIEKLNILHVPRYFLILLNRNRKYLLNVILKKKNIDDDVDVSFGNNICNKVILRSYDFSDKKYKHVFDRDFLIKFKD